MPGSWLHGLMKRVPRLSSGSPRSSVGDSELGVGFFIALTVVAVLFVVSIIESFRATGSVSYVAVSLAVVTGLYLVWATVAILFGRFVIAVIVRMIEKAKKPS